MQFEQGQKGQTNLGWLQGANGCGVLVDSHLTAQQMPSCPNLTSSKPVSMATLQIITVLGNVVHSVIFKCFKCIYTHRNHVHYHNWNALVVSYWFIDWLMSFWFIDRLMSYWFIDRLMSNLFIDRLMSFLFIDRLMSYLFIYRLMSYWFIDWLVSYWFRDKMMTYWFIDRLVSYWLRQTAELTKFATAELCIHPSIQSSSIQHPSICPSNIHPSNIHSFIHPSNIHPSNIYPPELMCELSLAGAGSHHSQYYYSFYSFTYFCMSVCSLLRCRGARSGLGHSV